MAMKDAIDHVLISEEQIQKRVRELGEQLTKDYSGKDVLLIGILKGSVMFMADLMKYIDNEKCKIDFMKVSSYGEGTSSSGNIKIDLDLRSSIEGKNIIMVEDILDTGNTLYYLRKILLTRSPQSVKMMTLLDKPERRVKEIEADYIGFTIPNEFVVGYGLDFDQLYRNLPYIGVLKPSMYGK